MKKTLYFAAVLAVLAGCSKTEYKTIEEGVRNISLSVAVDGETTRALYDGAGRIKFEISDKFAGAIAKADDPGTAIKVATKSGYKASTYKSDFTIADETAESPVFNGNIYSVVDADWADEFLFYGVFPSSVVYSAEQNLSKWAISLPQKQASTQSQWDKKCTAMLMQPATISTSDNTHDHKYGEYSATVNGNAVKFAHIFGYGRIDFAGIPEEYSGLKVKSVTIKAVGGNKMLAGNVTLDITKSIDEVELAPYSYSSTYDSIMLTPEETVPVSDYVA